MKLYAVLFRLIYRVLICIKDHINKIEPDAVLSLGQAAGRSAISVERIGINLDDFSIEDNKGNK